MSIRSLLITAIVGLAFLGCSEKKPAGPPDDGASAKSAEHEGETSSISTGGAKAAPAGESSKE